MGRGTQSFPTADRHPCCPLLPPTVSHGSRDTALAAGEIHKPLQRDIMDRMEVMLFSLNLMEGNSARVMGSGGAGSMLSGECPEDGTHKRDTGSG